MWQSRNSLDLAARHLSAYEQAPFIIDTDGEKLVLAGGTDVAEMVLFDVDALVRDCQADSESARRLEKQRSALCLPTGADGAYLLHAYIDEPIPSHLLKYCVADDCKSTILNISSGNIGFGGLESLYSNFKANDSIRSDAKIAAGSYDVTAHHTDYPENLIEDAVKSRIGARGMRIQEMPGYIVLVAVVATGAAFYASGWLAAVSAAAVAMAMLLVFRRHPLVVRLSRESDEVQSEYPSVVVGMRSHNASTDGGIAPPK